MTYKMVQKVTNGNKCKKYKATTVALGYTTLKEPQCGHSTNRKASLGALEAVVNDGLGAGLNAGDVVTHWVEAALGGVDLDDLLKRGLASGQLVLPESALRLALLDNERLGILSIGEHLLDEFRLVNVWGKSWLMEHPAGGQPSSNSSSHFVSCFGL